MFGLIGDMLSCIVIGFCISCFLIGLMLLIQKSMNPLYSLEIKGGSVALCLFILIFIHSVLLLGANHAKKYLDVMEKIVVTENQEISGIKQKIQDEYPALEKFVSTISERTLNSPSGEVTISFSSLVRNKINIYIYKRIGWLVALVLIGGTVLNYVAKKNSLKRNSCIRKQHMSGIGDSL